LIAPEQQEWTLLRVTTVSTVNGFAGVPSRKVRITSSITAGSVVILFAAGPSGTVSRIVWNVARRQSNGGCFSARNTAYAGISEPTSTATYAVGL
jgi:hypothetical protein